MKNIETIPNQLIRASAGSGKTYCLSVRYIRLLCHGVSPESIIALTFTRKAAGEFFGRIASQLSESALSVDTAKDFATSNGFSEWDNHIALDKLKDIVWQMPHLNLGTLDQFFFKVLTNFCFEYNIPDGFQVVDPIDLEREVNRLLGQILNERHHKGGAKDLMEILKEATFGVEYSTVSHLLKTITSSFHQLHLESPDEMKWGQPDIIWGAGSNPLTGQGDAESRIEQFCAFIKNKDLSDAQWEKWEDHFDFIRAYQPGMEISNGFKSLLGNINQLALEVEETGGGKLKFVNRKGIQFDSQQEFQLLMSLIQSVVKGEWLIKLRRTKGLYFLLQNFEKKYDSQLRRRGYITFSDVLYLLSQGPELRSGGISVENPDMRLDPDRRLAMDYRLNSTYDHWLLDEFQDTSRNQWKILENLVDEVVQDTGGDRSVFVVGDIKQSVYGWRGGDYKLFDFLLNRYARHESSNFSVDSLEKSYRSGPEILEFVNLVFDGHSNVRSFLGEGISKEWIWEKHTSALGGAQGHVAVFDFHKIKKPGTGTRSTAITQPVLEGLFHLIENLKPIDRGKSCAILVRRNEDSDLVTRYLRELGLPVSQSMDVPIAHDNLLVPAIVSCIQFLIHPEDSYAEWHLKMSPLYSVLSRNGESLDIFHQRNLSHLNSFGLSNWIEWILEAMKQKGISSDPFHAQRAKQLVEAARRYQNSNNNSLDDFLEFISGFHCQEAGTTNEIQVMTIHKSKGLGFDIVMLPQVNVPFSSGRGENMIIKRNDEGDIDWVSQVPIKNISHLNRTVRSVADEKGSREVFESLCLFYVACTRAKEGLYLLSDAKADSNTWAGFMHSGVNGSQSTQEPESANLGWVPPNSEILYESGRFPEIVSLKKSKQSRVHEPDVFQSELSLGLKNEEAPHIRRRIAKEQPSNRGVISCRHLFGAKSIQSRKVGLLVHKLLECVEWLSPDKDFHESLNHIWEETGLTNLEGFQESANKISKASRQKDFREIFHKPSEEIAICWREKSFELVHGNAWISGIMDRVVLIREKEMGSISKATIYDFKTDKILNESDYTSQVEIYALALSRITNMTGDCIEVKLVHVP